MAHTRTNLSPVSELVIELDRDGDALHRQIEASLRRRIRSGALPGGVALPASRALAAELGVSRGVVVEAYAQLVAEGYLTSRSGGYTQVARAPAPAPARATAPPPLQPNQSGAPWSRPQRPAVDFGYGRGNMAAFPRAAWLRSVRRVLTETPDDRLGYLDGRGAVELRSALAGYLNRVRGTSADPEAIIITNGYAQTASLLLGVLAARGATSIAVEDPSASDDARPIAAAHGMEVTGVPVGDDGVHVDAVSELRADALILTPSHQWPTGGVLSPAARSAVLAWAQRTGALVIEDDYDAEYRYDRAPVGAMQGLDPERVAYAGTASKTLAPGFRLGWVILPPDLIEPFAAAKLMHDRGSPDPGPADLRRFHRARRVRPPSAPHAPDLPLPPRRASGRARHPPARVRARGDRGRPASGDLAARRARRGRRDRGGRRRGRGRGRSSPPTGWRRRARGGLIFGYSNLSERTIAEGVSRLGRAIAGLRQGTTAGTAAGS